MTVLAESQSSVNIAFGYFEAGIVVAVGLVVGVFWLMNRKRGEDRAIDVPKEVVAAVATVVFLGLILAWNTGLLREEPLLFIGVTFGLIGIGIGASLLISLSRLRREFASVENRFGAQMAGLGNLQFFATKEDTISALTSETLGAREKIIATRFSPADIAVESEYWKAIRQRAMDPSILSIRIHSLAHASSTAVDGVCRLISEMRGAVQFRLGIAFYTNSFELIIADDRECIFCFHDLDMTIKDGFRVDTAMPSGSQVVSNFGSTVRRMIEDCYLVVDFGRWVQTNEDVERLQAHVRELHNSYRGGTLPAPIEPARRDDFLAGLLGERSARV